MSIGQTAAALGLTTSTLRYYDERGLVPPAERRGGHRMYGTEQLRRAALVQLMHGLGIPLSTAGVLLDAPEETWRTVVRDRIAEVDDLIARAQAARCLLGHALECPSPRPAQRCPELIHALDELIAGTPANQFAAADTCGCGSPRARRGGHARSDVSNDGPRTLWHS
ncbi:helix-turn-helix domain-containing protein [Micromonospora andamanensis]|nr:hypothetical protein Vwe01_56900 [Micromonospora andamanensis]